MNEGDRLFMVYMFIGVATIMINLYVMFVYH